MLASALKSSSHRRMSPRIIIAAMLVILVLSASIHLLQAAPDAPSVEWNKTFNGLHGNSVIQTADGGYAIAGYSATYSTDIGGYSGYKAVLIKTTSSGDVQWQKSYGPEVFGSDASAVSVVQTTDMGYLLFSAAGVLVKTDAEGNVQWNKPLGVAGVREGISSSDGGYLLVGNSKDTNGDDVAWLLKTDEQGNILWDQKFTGGFVVYTVIETAIEVARWQETGKTISGLPKLIQTTTCNGAKLTPMADLQTFIMFLQSQKPKTADTPLRERDTGYPATELFHG